MRLFLRIARVVLQLSIKNRLAVQTAALLLIVIPVQAKVCEATLNGHADAAGHEIPYKFPPETIHGKVVDDKGTALIGVTVNVKGTNIGTSTDARGEFAVTCSDDAVLIFSSVGFQTMEIKVRGKSNLLSVVLNLAEATLTDVVVVGYGTQSKKNLPVP